MGATFSRVKTWIAEKLTASDLNAEINNILDNFDPAGVDDYSTNEAAMQVQTDPGEPGAPVLATSLAGELERIRHQISEIKGGTYWYTAPVTTLTSLNSIFGTSVSQTRLVSGEIITGSNQSYLLTPEGSAGDNIVINGATTDLVYNVDGTQYTLAADVTISATTAPPLINNTAAINDASFTDKAQTKWAGMLGGGIPINTIGSEITSRNGKLTAMRLTTGAGSEYILCEPDTTNNQIKNVRRGWFFDETGAPVPSIVFADADTLTLMNIVYVFLTSGGASSITYNEPTVSSVEPTSPTTGDYWFDIANDTWKVYGVSSFAASGAVYIGMGVIDENDDCVAARSEDFSKTYIAGNTLELEYVSATVVQSNEGCRVGVFGSTVALYNDRLVWDMTADLDTGVSEAATTLFFFYMTEDGTPKISDVAPEDFTNTRGGFYHPHKTWRCVGQAWNDASQDLDKVISYHTDDASVAKAASSVAANALTLQYWTSPLVNYNLYDEDDSNNGKTKTVKFPFYQSLTVPSGATLDHISSAGGVVTTHADNIVLHIITQKNYTTLAVSSHQHGQGHLATSTALSTSSDEGLLFSLEAYTSAQVMAIAHGTGEQTTAGTWAAALTFFRAAPKINVCRVVRTLNIVSASTTSLTIAAVSNLDHTFMLTGSRKIRVSLVSGIASTSGGGQMNAIDTSGVQMGGTTAIYLSGVIQRSYSMNIIAGGNGANTISLRLPISNIHATFDVEEAGTGQKLFGIWTASYTSGQAFTLAGVKLQIEELPYNEDSL
jgi:hypothetical protein